MPEGCCRPDLSLPAHHGLCWSCDMAYSYRHFLALYPGSATTYDGHMFNHEEKAVTEMRLMHVDASPKRQLSNSKMLSAYFVESLKKQIPELTVDYLDLSVDTPPHVTGDFTRQRQSAPMP